MGHPCNMNNTQLQHCIGQPTNGVQLLASKMCPWSESYLHSLYTRANKPSLHNMRVSA